LVATGESSRFNEWGDPRPDFALADLFGAHTADPRRAEDESRRRKHASETAHTYLRLNPELRARVNGPQIGTEQKKECRERGGEITSDSGIQKRL
jgi:hypothetical protein